MEAFKGKSPHTPLRNETDIRIVVLLPNSQFNAPVECELEHIALQPEANYEAISYTWGDPTITEPILLDGQSYPVTVTLCTALRYLRSEESPRRLWVDSICINQKDTAERSHEIRKMRDIYKLASQVLIWIGDYHPFTRSHVKELFDFVIHIVTSTTQRAESKTITKTGLDEMWRIQEGIHEFFASRHWFQRMWIIQEVSVRRRLHMDILDETPVLICGHLQLHFLYLYLAGAFWSRPHDPSQLGLPQICPTIENLFRIWDNHQEMVKYPKSYSGSPGRQIAWILSLAAELFHATDHRDFIYSIYGLIVTNHFPPQLLPDYNNKSVENVLLESAIYIIESGTVDIIQFNSMQMEKLPSWVPDWRYRAPLKINNHFPLDYGIQFRILDRLALEVDMLVFTEIKATGPELDMTRSLDNEVYMWSEFILDVERSLYSRMHQVKGHHSFVKAICQLLLVFDMRTRQLDDIGWHMSALENTPSIFAYSGRPNYNKPGPSDTLERLFECQMWRGVGESINNKLLFRCSDHSVGIMGQANVKPQIGDLICSIKGACGEFVLRPFKDGFKLVGICQRSVKCFDTKLADVGLDCWLEVMHILDDLEPLWETKGLKRILIY